jgi:hypothetical protein
MFPNYSKMEQSIGRGMDEWTIKTPNPKCRLFFKIDLLTDFASFCLKDFIDWRYIHSWLVFWTQFVNYATMDELYLWTGAPLPSFWPSPPSLPPNFSKILEKKYLASKQNHADIYSEVKKYYVSSKKTILEFHVTGSKINGAVWELSLGMCGFVPPHPPSPIGLGISVKKIIPRKTE